MFGDENRQQQYSTDSDKTQASAKEAWLVAPPFPVAHDISKLKIAVGVACACKTQLETALVYAEDGIPVLPCNWKPVKLDDGSYKIKKYPLIPWGVYGATIDPEQIKQWWTKWPVALIGVPGGVVAPGYGLSMLIR